MQFAILIVFQFFILLLVGPDVERISNATHRIRIGIQFATTRIFNRLCVCLRVFQHFVVETYNSKGYETKTKNRTKHQLIRANISIDARFRLATKQHSIPFFRFIHVMYKFSILS